MNKIDKAIVIGFFLILIAGVAYGKYTAPRGNKYVVVDGKYYVRSDVDVNKLQERLQELEKKQAEIKNNKDTPEARCRAMSREDLIRYCVEAEDTETAPPIDYSEEIQQLNEEINSVREAATIEPSPTEPIKEPIQ